MDQNIIDFPSTTTSLPSPLPPSHLYTLRETTTSGRGVFATQPISSGTTVLHTSNPSPRTINSPPQTPHIDPHSPLAWLIQRPYRKEVCATCFTYDRGREFKIKVPDRDCGVVFCSESCRDVWIAWNGDIGLSAWENLERGAKDLLKRGGGANVINGDAEGDVQMLDVDGVIGVDRGQCDGRHNHDGEGNSLVPVAQSRHSPTEEEIRSEWNRTKLIGDVIISARTKDKQNKNEKKVLRNVVEKGGDPDLMYYLLTAVINTWNISEGGNSTKTQDFTGGGSGGDDQAGTTGDSHDMGHHLPQTTTCPSRPALVPAPTSVSSPTTTISTTPAPPYPLWPLYSLTPTTTAYLNTHTSLPLLLSSHLFLLTLLPISLLPHLPPHLSHNLITRAAHNAFSIRPASNTDGPDSGEFLGWGVYPSASFFNHSCDPNMGKGRRGRGFGFWVQKRREGGNSKDVGMDGGVEKGEELCISYLGGEERDLNVQQRRARLFAEWGFWCNCSRCLREESVWNKGLQGEATG